jgi:two-component system alkaline phosphatase synthesis response regulator PhoP
MATILCIDDDPLILEILCALLTHRGSTVLTATDGVTGIALARQHNVDVVVLDFHMPGLDGNQVAQVLMRENPTLPVVVWSGAIDNIPECLKWFADAVLRKEDGTEALISTVEEIVASKEISRKAAVPRQRLSA